MNVFTLFLCDLIGQIMLPPTILVMPCGACISKRYNSLSSPGQLVNSDFRTWHLVTWWLYCQPPETQRTTTKSCVYFRAMFYKSQVFSVQETCKCNTLRNPLLSRVAQLFSSLNLTAYIACWNTILRISCLICRCRPLIVLFRRPQKRSLANPICCRQSSATRNVRWDWCGIKLKVRRNVVHVKHIRTLMQLCRCIHR